MILSLPWLQEAIFIISYSYKTEAWGEIKKYIKRDEIKRNLMGIFKKIPSNKSKGKQQMRALCDGKTKGGRSQQGETRLIQSL